MGKGKRYTDNYEEMIVDLYKSGINLKDLSSEYGTTWMDKWLKGS